MLKVGAHVGYRILKVQSPWFLELRAGSELVTTWTVGDAFGFQGVASPQIGIRGARELGALDRLELSLSLGPVSNGLGLLPLTSRQIHAALHYETSRVFRKVPLFLAVDYMNLAVTVSGRAVAYSGLTSWVGVSVPTTLRAVRGDQK
jgi:hypothetical protein